MEPEQMPEMYFPPNLHKLEPLPKYSVGFLILGCIAGELEVNGQSQTTRIWSLAAATGWKPT
jgi:hypothetical protein